MSCGNGNICANCQFWDGPRKVSVFKTSAEVKGIADKDICTNRQSLGTRGLTKLAMYNLCRHFQKWDQLK